MMKNKYILIISLIVILFNAIIFSIILFIKKEGNTEKEEYVPIQNITKELKGHIIKSRLSFEWKGTYVYELNNGIKFSLSGHTINTNYFKQNLIDFLQINDSIYKPDDSDSIYVYKKNGNEYYFILGKKIN